MHDSGTPSRSDDSSASLESPQVPDSSKGVEVPWLASPRQIDHPWMSVAEWTRRVEQNTKAPNRLDAQLVFLGDSITEGWTDVAPGVWAEAFGSYRPLRLGIGGDQTQNLLWRMEHGELDGLRPKVLALLIGVNNIWWGGFSPEDTARGIAAVATNLTVKLPHTKIIVQGIFPAGRRSQDELRLRIVASNQETQKLLHGIKDVTFLDLGSSFLAKDGSIDQKIMHDFLHLTEEGYSLWASALKERLTASLL